MNNKIKLVNKADWIAGFNELKYMLYRSAYENGRNPVSSDAEVSFANIRLDQHVDALFDKLESLGCLEDCK